MYNKAFLKLGIKDAIQVKQMPDDADWDIADLRYNVIRWTTGMPFAIALFRANPVTGQILNACINMDGGFASAGTYEFESIFDPMSSAPVPSKSAFDPRQCTYFKDGETQFRFGELALAQLGGLNPAFDREEYIRQYIRETVGHEFGHCLGLRHNFAASNELTMDQLADSSVVKEHGISASLMDYNAFNIAAVKKRGVDVYSQTIGTYDYWAIEYGYKPIVAKTSKGEKYELAKVASKSGTPGLRYESDRTANGIDPTVATFDLSAEPIAYFKRSLAISRYLLQNLDKKKPEFGQSYYDFTKSYTAALRYYINAAVYMPRYLGGVALGNSFRGDTGERKPISPIDAKTQQDALSLLNTYVFSPNAFAFPKEDLLKLSFNPDQPGNEASGTQREYPMRSTFENYQRTVLSNVLSPRTLGRVAENEFRTPPGGKCVTVAELIRSVDANIWAELATGAEIPDLRRQLQRENVRQLIGLALAPDRTVPGDARVIAESELRSLLGKIRNAVPKAKGPYGKAHLQDCADRIGRALNAVTVVGG
jgi:hypothetical protein